MYAVCFVFLSLFQGVNGFLRREECEGITLLPGMVMECIVKERGGRRPVQVTTEPQSLRAAVLTSGQGVQFGCVLPGVLVEGTVQGICQKGLVVEFLSGFAGTVDLFHIQQAS